MEAFYILFSCYTTLTIYYLRKMSEFDFQLLANQLYRPSFFFFVILQAKQLSFRNPIHKKYKRSLSKVLSPAESSNYFLNESQSIVAPQPLPTLPPKPRWVRGNLVSHQIQVFSVSIHPSLGQDCGICGVIQVVDDEKIFSIFKRGRDDPEAISSAGGNLTLIDLSSDIPTHVRNQPSNFISCRKGPAVLRLILGDSVKDLVVIEETHLTLHAAHEDIEKSCDKLIETTVQCKRGTACIYYATFVHAVIVTVKIDIFSKDDNDWRSIDYFEVGPKYDNDDCSSIDVYGKVVAMYGNARRFCGIDDQVENMKTTLFDKPFPQFVKVKIYQPK